MSYTDWIIIGKYFNRNMIVTGLSFDKSPRKDVKQTSRGKAVGNIGQEVNLTVEGHLMTSSFEELHKEIDLIYEALNEGEISIVLGDNPSVFYSAIWNGANFERKPGGGGHNVPFSLTFQMLEDSAVKSAPATSGYRQDSDLPAPVTQQGFFHTPSFFQNIKGFYGEMRRPASGQGVFLFSGVIGLVNESDTSNRVDVYNPDGRFLKAFRIPATPTVKLGVTYLDGITYVYINGVPHKVFDNPGSVDYVDSNISPLIEWALIFETPLPIDYIAVLNKFTKDDVIKRVNIPAASTTLTLNYSGTAEAPVSLISSVDASLGSYTMNNFGAEFYGSGRIIVNGIAYEVISTNPANLDTLGYGGKRRLFPYLKNGRNILNKTANVSADLFYLERYY